jgi:hypothetical protein
LLRQGYAVSSVNVRVSTIKSYAKLAFKAGVSTMGLTQLAPKTCSEHLCWRTYTTISNCDNDIQAMW